MKSFILLLLWQLSMTACQNGPVTKSTNSNQVIEEGIQKVVVGDPSFMGDAKPIAVGASHFDQYLHLLQGKNVGLVVNQTSTIGEQHLVDVLIEKGVKVSTVFAPEHGFRGTADAGEKVKDDRDLKTGLPIISLYGKNKKPSEDQLSNLDIVVFDIQDVGARFYTYISTMHYVMEACAELGKPIVILDRPNPNGHYVDGPVLDSEFSSFVGMHEIPIVHGMTVGELALMINEEKWLKGNLQCALTIVPCTGYTHLSTYDLPIKPSPNLPNLASIYLYPSLCLFEGTAISVGRGTDLQFQVVGHPEMTDFAYRFTPVSKPGAKYPKHQNVECRGLNLGDLPIEELRGYRKIQLGWIIDFYYLFKNKEKFFNENNFIDKLAGSDLLRKQIESGVSEAVIRSSWEPALSEFKNKRKRYLIYQDFE